MFRPFKAGVMPVALAFLLLLHPAGAIAGGKSSARNGSGVLQLFKQVLFGKKHRSETAAEEAYGESIVTAWSFDAQNLESLNAYNRSSVNSSGRPKSTVGVFPDALELFMQSQTAFIPAKSPYKIVIKTKGLALGNGDVVVRWQSQMHFHEGPAIGKPQAAVRKKQAQSNEAITLVVESAPFSVSKARTGDLMLFFVQADNMQVTAVDVEIWQGMDGYYSDALITFLRFTLMGLVLLGVWWWFFKRNA